MDDHASNKEHNSLSDILSQKSEEKKIDPSLESNLSDLPLEAESEIDSLRQKITELQSDHEENKKRTLRALADLENTRKRAERDRKDAEIYGGTRLARDILSVFDNLDRALGSISQDLKTSEPDLVSGLELTRSELLNAFSKHKILPLTPQKGDLFDHQYHQAMFESPTNEYNPGQIVDILQSGFMISDRLLRPALVGVAKKVESNETQSAQEISEKNLSEKNTVKE